MSITLLRTLPLALALCLTVPAHAAPSTAAVERCLADSTNGKDRKDLARWIYLSIAAHPEMRGLSNASADDTAQSSRVIGQLFTRLITESCAKEIRTMVAGDGRESLKTAFEFLGRLAMQELMSNPEVGASVSMFERYTDRARIAGVLDAKQP